MNEGNIKEFGKIIQAQRDRITALENTLRLRQFERERLDQVINTVMDEILQAENFICTLENIIDTAEDKVIQNGLKNNGKRARKPTGSQSE